MLSDRRLGEVGHRFGSGDVGRVEVERAHPLLCGLASVAEGPEDLGRFLAVTDEVVDKGRSAAAAGVA
jgi:hypothetical protein